MSQEHNSKKLSSDFKFYSGQYSHFIEEKSRFEDWSEAVDRVMTMHGIKYSDKLSKDEKLRELLDYAAEAYKDQAFLGSQRALQFGFSDTTLGILKHNSKMFNCLVSYADRLEFFQEAMYWLLSGCGVGFRIFQKDVDKYSGVAKRTKGVKTFVVPDSIEGWSDALGVLMSSYSTLPADQVPFPEYQGYRVDFDLSLIRPKGAKIAGGFKAPGPEGLRDSLLKISELIEKQFVDGVGVLRTIDAYDIVMHASDAVLSGGVRRSATIALFHKDDDLMLNAKTGNWGTENPQRARSNNSVLLLKNGTTKEEFDRIIESVKGWGEPGFVWTEDYDIVYNPCVEIGMMPKFKVLNARLAKELKCNVGDWVSGWQGCNLTEINGAYCDTEEKFYRACEASAIMGTLQAGYTDFKYVGKVSKLIFDKEALLGCSITGYVNNPEILLNEKILKKGARLIKKINKMVAKMIGINAAARCTCTKPSGNASVLLMTASGIHGEHAKRYFRHMQIEKNNDFGNALRAINPEMFEESVWSRGKTDYMIAFPEEAKEGSIFKDELLGVKLLAQVKMVQNSWVEEGTNVELCTVPYMRHNVSNTINVDDWDQVRDYIYENRENFAGVSLLGMSGDKDYKQAPFTAVLTAEEIVQKYGVAGIFASGLVVDGLHAFGDLWDACSQVVDPWVKPLEEVAENALKRDWVRRFKKFATKHFYGDYQITSYLLKDAYLLHKWERITSNMRPVDWTVINVEPEYTDVNQFGAIACSGPNGCEIPAGFFDKNKNDAENV